MPRLAYGIHAVVTCLGKGNFSYLVCFFSETV